ncbi:hypothetical protein TNCV_192341, partial [Trichonephila clavipes]
MAHIDITVVPHNTLNYSCEASSRQPGFVECVNRGNKERRIYGGSE